MKNQSQLRRDAAQIWTAALKAVDPYVAVRRHVRMDGNRLLVAGIPIELNKAGSIWVIGAGKAAAPMGQAMEKILGDRLAGGLLVTRYGHGLPLRNLELLEASHPVPDANSVAAAARLASMAEHQISSRDLVFCLLSGGGSALLVAPADGITWEDKVGCTRTLLKSGARIQEMNAIRKHLSNLKGGGLARILAPVRVISLILSDVVGDDLDAIASGPLVADTSTFQDCAEILRRLHVEDQVPVSVLRRVKAGVAGRIPETPKPGNAIFRRKSNIIVGSNSQACGAAARAARRLGYRTLVLSSRMEGDTAEAAGFHLEIAREIIAEGRPLRRPACLISGGETTVRVTGSGLGGRNQEFALQCVRGAAEIDAPCVCASVATDGTDGPTEAAGALVDNSTLARSFRFGPNFLDECRRNNDSHEFFKRLGDLIETGPTRTNVMDLHLLLIG